MLHLSLCSCRQMILSSRGLEKCKHVYKPFQVPNCIYLIGFLHDHGWLHIGNSWGELLADDHVEATPPVLHVWPWKLKSDDKKSTHAHLAPQIGFDPAFLQSLLHNANHPPLPPSNPSSPMDAPFVRVMVKSKVQWSVGLGILFLLSFDWIAIVKHNSSPLWCP